MTQFSENFWNETNVLVTGGASFIGSHLVDRLISLGARVSVADDLSTGTMDNLEQSKDKIKFIRTDLEYNSKSEARNIFRDNEIVFHLAADHGGRGYIASHPADVCSSFAVVVKCLAFFASVSSSVIIQPPPPAVIILLPLKLITPIWPKVPVCLSL